MLDRKVISSISGLSIEVADGTKIHKFHLGEIFDIDEANLTQEFAEQSGLFAFFSALWAKSEFNSSVIEFGLEQEQASADADSRSELEAAGKKYTEAVIRGMISLDEECSKLMESLLGQRYESKLLKAICDALKMRADMLISMGSHIRHEMDSMGLQVKEKKFNKSLEDVKKVVSEKRKQV
jgi:hypothetical protein